MRRRAGCEPRPPPPLAKHNKRSCRPSTREPGRLSDRRKRRLPSLRSAARLGGTAHQRASALFENSLRYFHTYTFLNTSRERRGHTKEGTAARTAAHRRQIYGIPAVHSNKRRAHTHTPGCLVIGAPERWQNNKVGSQRDDWGQPVARQVAAPCTLKHGFASFFSGPSA